MATSRSLSRKSTIAAKEEFSDTVKLVTVTPQQSHDSGPSFVSWTWWNQKLAKFLGDVEQPPAIKGKTAVRAGCRIILTILLLVQFLVLLIYYYKQSPDVQVKQMTNVFPSTEENYNSITELFNATKPTPDDNRKSTKCPCTKTSIPWTNLLKFYFVRSTSTVWNVSFDPRSDASSPSIILPDSDPEDIVRDPTPVDAKSFCHKSEMWPKTTTTSQSQFELYGSICSYLAYSIFPGDPDIWNITEYSNSQILESLYLLNREVLYRNVAALARAAVLERRLKLEMLNQNNLPVQEYYNGLSYLLTTVLDSVETEPNLSYVYGAIYLNYTLSTIAALGWKKPKVFITRGANGSLLFLHPEIDWMGYYEACASQYCDVISPISTFRQVYRAVGLLGGVASIVLGISSYLLWPTTAYVLKYFNH